MVGPTRGIKILDLTQGVMGPMATMILADMGAEVIKIEPDVGDWNRLLGPPFVNGQSPGFLSVNRNKKSIVLNLTKGKGKEIVQELAKGVDIFLEAFRPGVITKLGLDYNTISQINPQIVYCSLSAYGQEGPYRDRPGSDVVMQAVSGLMSITGEAGGSPLRCGTVVTDMVAAVYGVAGIALALFERERTGQGQKIEICLLDCAIAFQSWNLGLYLTTGILPERCGNLAGGKFAIPSQSFRTRDGHIMIAAHTAKQWPKLCEALGMPHLINDPKFNTNARRVEHQDELLAMLENIFNRKMTNEWLQILEAKGVNCGPINTYKDLVAHPQVLANQMIVGLKHPSYGEIKVTGIPIKFLKTPGEITTPPPVKGEHTQEILSQIGYTGTQIQELKEAGIVWFP